MKNAIVASIILCTYNREKTLQKSIDSLLHQTYPKNRYEIIVVDDGSVKPLKKDYVSIIRHKNRLGLASARNTGLKAAVGEIIICFDDDAIADKTWLSNIIHRYSDSKVIGVGAMLKLPQNSSLTDEFCYEMGYGMPIPMTYLSTSTFNRFIVYLKSNFINPQSSYKNGIEVLELPGIVSSFRKNIIISVGGWNDLLVGIAEDVDLCRRIKEKFPNLKFVVAADARIVHKQNLSFLGFIYKEFKRGNTRKMYYQSLHKVPPIFPLPILLIIICSILFYFKYYLIILLIPYAIYPWWIVRFVKMRNARLLAFPYLQFAHESATVAGLFLN